MIAAGGDGRGPPISRISSDGGQPGLSPARGPWASTRMARGRLAGLGAGGGGGAWPAQGGAADGGGGGGGWAAVSSSNDSGTMVLKGPPGGSASVAASATFVVRSSGAAGSAGGGSAGMAAAAGETMTPLAAAIASARAFMASGERSGASAAGPGPGSELQQRLGDAGAVDALAAAVAAAGDGGGSDYMAALQSAARERGGGFEPGRSPGTAAAKAPPPSVASARGGGGEQGGGGLSGAAAAAAAADKLQARLHAVYEGGLVVPLPFLSAAHAAPLALLDPLHCSNGGSRGSSNAAGLDPAACEVLLELVATPSLLGGGASAAGAAKGSNGGVLNGGAPHELPPHVLHKARCNPALQNLARSLAYQRACLAELPLDLAAAVEAQQVVDDLTHALRTILCLW